MTDDFEEIDNVGPSRADSLEELGYESYEELADAEYEELADSVNRLNEDTALEIVVQAQNLADLDNATVEEDEADESDGETDDELNELGSEPVDEEAEEDEEEEDVGPTVYEFSLSLETEDEYNTLYHALIEERCTRNRTNRSGVDLFENAMASMRGQEVETEVTFEMTGDELNEMHNAIMSHRVDYQGNNLIDYMDALMAVESRLNEVRSDKLF